jgi:hypothetical protein
MRGLHVGAIGACIRIDLENAHASWVAFFHRRVESKHAGFKRHGGRRVRAACGPERTRIRGSHLELGPADMGHGRLLCYGSDAEYGNEGSAEEGSSVCHGGDLQGSGPVIFVPELPLAVDQTP